MVKSMDLDWRSVVLVGGGAEDDEDESHGDEELDPEGLADIGAAAHAGDAAHGQRVGDALQRRWGQ